MKRFEWNLRWSTSTILGVVAFQLAFGVGVFVITRAVYDRNSVAAVGVPLGSPHGIPTPGSTKRLALLPGSERITAEHALQLLQVDPAGRDAAYNAGGNINPKDLARAADRHFREGLFQKAAGEYTRLLDYAPGSVDIYNNLGLTLHHINRAPEAVEYLKKGISLNASHQRIWLTLGFVQINMGEVAAARRTLSKAVELDPESRVGLEAKRLLREYGQ